LRAANLGDVYRAAGFSRSWLERSAVHTKEQQPHEARDTLLIRRLAPATFQLSKNAGGATNDGVALRRMERPPVHRLGVRTGLASGAVPVVTQAVARLDDDQVEPHGQGREASAARQHACLTQSKRCPAQPRSLAVVHGFLGESIVTPSAPAHLDDHQRCRRSRVNGQQVNLRAADADLPAEDAPSPGREVRGNPFLSSITGTLEFRAHVQSLAARTYPGITRA
jgi:hypothetical protein